MRKPLSAETKAIVKSTAPALQQHGLAITTRMYERLFTEPDVKAMFDQAAQESGEQPKRLAGAILAYAQNIDKLEALTAPVMRMAARHVETGVKAEHYPLVANALLPAIRDVLGDAATDEVLGAWGEAYWALADILIGKEEVLYAETDGNGQPEGINPAEQMDKVTDLSPETAPRLVWSRYYSTYVAAPPGPGARERLIAVAGAIIGIVTTGLLCGVLAGTGAAHPLLVAPMGASAVLLFAVPASPLAQPWSILGGNVLSALVGIAVVLAVPNNTVAAGLGVGLAIAIMSLARCLHPPGGAVALSAVLGGAAGSAHPFMFALYPVGLNSLLLILAGLAFHRMSGHTYPHRVKLTESTHGTQDSAPLSRSGVKPKDIDAALEGFGDTLDINRDDLLRIFELAGLNAAERQVEQLSCNDIMSRDVITIAATAPVEEAHRLLRARHLRALPVENVSGQLVGVITWPDLDKQGAFASEIMAPADTAHVSAPAAELLAPLANGHGHEVMIVDDNMQLQGIVTQTDIIASLITKAVTLNTK